MASLGLLVDQNGNTVNSAGGSGWAASIFNGLANLGSSIAGAVEGNPTPLVGPTANAMYPVYNSAGQIVSYSATPSNSVGVTASASSGTLILVVGAILAIFLLRK